MLIAYRMMDVTFNQPARWRSRLWLQLILFLCFVACLLVGLMSITALIWLSNADRAIVSGTSLPEVDSSNISARLSLHQLAGDSAAALALQAINAGDLETAWAILAYLPASSNVNQMATLYQLLSRRMQGPQMTELRSENRISELQRLARALATLSPQMDTTVRSQLLLQGTRDLLSIGNIADAKVTAVQLQRLAQQAPDLLPAQRSQIIEPLKQLSHEFSEPEFEQRLIELSRNPYLSPAGEYLPSLMFSLVIWPKPSPEIELITSQRKQAAALLINRLSHDTAYVESDLFASGMSAEQDGLGRALLVEDEARKLWLQQILAGDSSPEEKLGALLSQHEWVLLKARIGVGGFGLTLVPEWRDDLSSIEDELSLLTGNIDNAIDTLMDSIALPRDKAILRVEKFMWLALQYEFGRFSRGSKSLLSNDLHFAQQELERQGLTLALPVYLDTELSRPEFQIRLLPVR